MAARTARDFDLCKKYGNLCQLITIGIPLLYSILRIGYQIPAFYNISAKGIIRPSIGVYFPGINESDAIDMSVLMLAYVVFATWDIIILFVSDTFIGMNFSTTQSHPNCSVEVQ